MLKALLKKQFTEIITSYFVNRKTGKKLSKSGIVGFAVLFIFLFFTLSFVFAGMAWSLSVALVPMGLGWLFFSIMGLIGIFFGVFGSVFNTYTGLYHAKDNDLLLSMPIQPSKILFTRITGIYAMGLLFESIVLVPTIVVWILIGFCSVLSIVFSILFVPILALFVTAISCLLGFAVAFIAGKLKNKSFVTVFLSLLFFVIYYVVYYNATAILQSIVANGNVIGDKFRLFAYPLFLFGRACEGDILSAVLLALIIFAVFAAVYALLSKTFISITTKKVSAKKSEFKDKQIKTSSMSEALLKKEFKRLLSSANYMLNCALGTVLMPVGGVLLLVFRSRFSPILEEFGSDSPLVAVIFGAIIMLLSSINLVTGPSISLEGKNIWILQSLPIDTKKIFDAKKSMHNILTIPPVIFIAVCGAIALNMNFWTAIAVTCNSVVFVMLIASFGLAVNLKTPNLSWTNEVVPIKQNFGSLIVIFGGWVFSILVGVGGFFLTKFVSPLAYFAATTLVIFAVVVLIDKWINKNGVKIFKEL